MSYSIKLETFEGPLDLLFHLIEKNEIDIYNIPISEVTNQYLEYINSMNGFDMEIASEFLLMAATLLEIKSKMLLPNLMEEQLEFDVQGMDPRRDLVLKLIEYKKYKNVADFFKKREEVYGRIHFREQGNIEELFNNKVDYKKIDIKMEEEVLIEAFNRVLKKINRMDEHRKTFFQELKRDIHTVEEKIELIKQRGIKEKEIKFSNLFSNDYCKMEVVVTFLAVLELLKLKVINIMQTKQFDEIYISFIDIKPI